MENELSVHRARLAEAEREAREVVAHVTNPTLRVIDFQLERQIVCNIVIHRDLFLRTKNPSEMINAICRTLGDAVADEALKFAREETRPFGEPARRGVRDTSLRVTP